jgi:protein Y49E10.29, partially confirmed by transcript evidence
MGIYEQLAAEHAQRERAQRERAQQMAAMAAREAAMREAAMRAQAQQAQLAQAQRAAANAAAAHAATQRAAAQHANAAHAAAAQATAARAGQYPHYQDPRYQHAPGPVPGQNFAPQQSPGPTAPGYNPAAPAAPMPGYPATPAPGHPAQFAPPAPQSAARAQSAPKAGRLRSKLFGGKRRERTAEANQLANRVVGNVANGAQPPLMAPPFPPGLQQSAPQPPAPAPAPSAPAQSQAPLPAAPAAAAAAPTDAPASAIKRFKALSIKRTPKPKAPIPAPADKNTEHNLAHYKSLPTVGPENVDALHLMAVGTSIWALAAVGLSILLGATASRSAALGICLCGIVIGVIGMAWGGVHEYRKALGRGPLSEDNSTPVDDVAAGEALSLRYRDI